MALDSQLMLRLDPADYAALVDMAAADSRSISAMGRLLLTEALRFRQTIPPRGMDPAGEAWERTYRKQAAKAARKPARART